MAVAIVKSYNAVAECYCIAQRVGLSAPMAALRLLQRATAIRCEPCLAMSTDRPTDTDNIRWLMY